MGSLRTKQKNNKFTIKKHKEKTLKKKEKRQKKKNERKKTKRKKTKRKILNILTGGAAAEEPQVPVEEENREDFFNDGFSSQEPLLLSQESVKPELMSMSNSQKTNMSLEEEELLRASSIKQNFLDVLDTKLSQNQSSLNFKKTSGICDSHTMHHLQSQIEDLNNKMIQVNYIVLKIIRDIAHKLFIEYLSDPSLLKKYQKDSLDWFIQFNKVYGFQRFSENDIINAIKYRLHTYDPSEQFYIVPNSHRISRLFTEYRYKIMTSFFTKASISHAVLSYKHEKIKGKRKHNGANSGSHSGEYIYLENLFSILSLANEGINTTLKAQWIDYIGVEYDNSSYIHSGGNIFVLLAGMLCYIKELKELTLERPIMNSIVEKLKIKIGEQYSDFIKYLQTLFENEEFIRCFQTIMDGGLSDIDFLFMSSTKGFFQHKTTDKRSYTPSLFSNINALSASILRTILCNTHAGDETYKSLFPFMEQYTEIIPTSRMFNNSGISDENITKIDAHGLLRKIRGFRQTSSYIDEINIGINRIKQAYNPLGPIIESLQNVPPQVPSLFQGPPQNVPPQVPSLFQGPPQYDEFITKYGECLDLVIGSTNNPIFKHKCEQYEGGLIYNINTLYDELEKIGQTTQDDKSEKRLHRMKFLDILRKSEYSRFFNYLLVLCYEELHTNKQGGLIGFPCFYKQTQQQSLISTLNVGFIPNNNEL